MFEQDKKLLVFLPLHLHLHYGDVGSSGNLTEIIYDVQPEEVYHLAAQSHVRVSFDLPEYTSDITALGTMRILEAIRKRLGAPAALGLPYIRGQRGL